MDLENGGVSSVYWSSYCVATSLQNDMHDVASRWPY